MCEIDALRHRVAELERELLQTASAASGQQDAVDHVALTRAIAAHVAEGTFVLDRSGLTIFVNPAGQRMFGWTGEELRGRRLHDVIHFSHRDDSRLRTALEDGCALASQEDVFRHRDGHAVPVLWSHSPADGGGVYRSVLVVHDVTARKQAEAALRESDAKFQALVEQAPMATHVISLNGRVIRANRAWEQLFGVTVEQIRDFNAFSDPQLAERGILPYMLRARAGEVVEIPEMPFVPDRGTHAGRTLWIRSAAYPVRDEHGDVREVVLVQENVTERKAAEEELRRSQAVLQESESRYRLAVRAANSVIWDWHVPTGQVIWSDLLRPVFGYGPESAGSDIRSAITWWSSHIHPDQREAVTASFEQLTSSDAQTWCMEYEFERADGTWAYVLDQGYVGRDDQGRPVRVIGSMLDITDRKRAEEARRASDERYRAIVSQATAGIAEVDLSGRFTFANDRYCSIVGRSRGDLLRLCMQDITHPDDLPGNLVQFRRALETGEPFVIEKRYVRPDGASVWVVNSVSVVRNAGGHPQSIIAVTHDISERRRAEQELRQSNEELARVNRELEEFAFVASHDLQEPLRTVNVYTQLILRHIGAGDAKLNLFGGYVRQAVARMEALIRDLLTYSRTVRPDETATGTASLAAALNEAMTVLHDRIEETGTVIQVGAELPLVCGDTGQLAHVFQNLLSNAMKYHKPGVAPIIRITAEKRGREWVISMQDNGIGFEQKYAERIFGLFKRLHKDEYPGTGLGLAICHRIVQRCGGRMWAVGCPGQGATFLFALPDAGV